MSVENMGFYRHKLHAETEITSGRQLLTEQRSENISIQL